MPYPNEHAARLKNPGQFAEGSFRRTNGSGKGMVQGVVIPSTIAVIWAKPKVKDKPSDPPLAQALRFPISNWTEAQARAWLKNNKIKFILFEPAAPEEKKAVKKRAYPKAAYAEAPTENQSTWRYPHHDQKDGKLQVNREMLKKALSAARGETTGVRAKAETLAHLEEHAKSEGEDKRVQKRLGFRLMKANARNRVVLGIVYEPDVVDYDGDWASREVIEKACHGFMMRHGVVGVMHDGSKTKSRIEKEGKRRVVECYVAPVNMVIGEQTIREGTWIIGVKILDDADWQGVLDGKYNGFSMDGWVEV